MIVVAGGGVVGLHVGIALAGLPAHPPIFVCERESTLGHHTSGRNSEVVHAGFAYPPDSLKAHTCVRGNDLTYRWLERLDVPHVRCGKWIVAFEPSELPALEQVLTVGGECDVPALREASPSDVSRSEPGCRRFVGAVHSGSSGLMDAAAYLRALERYFVSLEDCYYLAPCAVTSVDVDKRTVGTTRGDMEYELLVNAAGLWADDVYRISGGERGFRIKPFKGEYCTWRRGPIRTMVYGVPRRYLPRGQDDGRQVSYFGVHVHRSVGGDVFVGPTQVELDWDAKADYRIVTPRETFLAELSRYAEVPDPEDLQPAFAGNRPKLYEDGLPLGDFQVLREGRHVHLLGIESPGLTAAPALAAHVAELVAGIVA